MGRHEGDGPPHTASPVASYISSGLTLFLMVHHRHHQNNIFLCNHCLSLTVDEDDATTGSMMVDNIEDVHNQDFSPDDNNDA
ncbi:hypothetical protein HAX54_037648 [Datura stramonium]|uniref:Uncharacterized protein n=1 Tax=Datura stramonium TaxID=4076 RepID=A0ABS8VLF6_DATST|nr:hypothetical protein [Datura stramonium]